MVPVQHAPELADLIEGLNKIPDYRVYGRVAGVQGMTIEVVGLERVLSIGSRCLVQARDGRAVPCAVIGFDHGKARLLPFGALDGVGLGSKAEYAGAETTVSPDERWLGRVVNALGEPVDGGGPLSSGAKSYLIDATPLPANQRRRLGGKLDLGVKAINSLLTCCSGQRMGIFAGSGVGKSILLSMMARYTEADVIVIGLIGERGREVQEWLQDDLGEEGLARSVVVVATSDEPALMRRQAAQLTMALSEFFRDRGLKVLCLMDSVTRFAMALREIGLAGGEPPASKGYTPSVFAELPKLLERAGPGTGEGTITGLFTVLVEGDDHNEPISDAVRGILDGHIVLERSIAERNRYPAINVLKSISRALPNCNDAAENALVTKARQLLSTYEDMAELIRIGAYKLGSDPTIDEAIHYYPLLEAFLSQDESAPMDLAECYRTLAQILGMEWNDQALGEAEPEDVPAAPEAAGGSEAQVSGEAPPVEPVERDPSREAAQAQSRRRMAAALNLDLDEVAGTTPIAETDTAGAQSDGKR